MSTEGQQKIRYKFAVEVKQPGHLSSKEISRLIQEKIREIEAVTDVVENSWVRLQSDNTVHEEEIA